LVERWVRPTVARSAGRRGIVGWEIWNEPDQALLPQDVALELNQVENYVELLKKAVPVVRTLDPTRLVVGAATRSIQQNYPRTLEYNKRMKELGVEELVDIWNIHYYGEQYENVVRNGGVADFLNDISKPNWVTEIGETNPDKQLAYAERTIPFLTEKVDNLERFYWYQFTSTEPLDSNYGLRNPSRTKPISDLYRKLRDRD